MDIGLNYPCDSAGGCYSSGFHIGDFSVAWYGVIILTAGLVALLLSSYNARREGFSFDFFLTIFIVAFPMGIIGSRIWYVIAEWSNFADNPLAIFDLKSGGLAIQGGAIGGILGGVIFAKFRRRGMKLMRGADYAIPTILVAQAIGRWGNFFNQEVYGQPINPEAWSFLPSFITNNMQGGAIGPDMVAPLFLIEGILNITGYFLLIYFCKPVLRKFLNDGDLAFGYLIVYGIVRMIMEPMRNSTFIMGDSVGKAKSLSMAIAFLVVGIILIFLNHLFRYLDKKGCFKTWTWLDKFFGRPTYDERNRLIALGYDTDPALIVTDRTISKGSHKKSTSTTSKNANNKVETTKTELKPTQSSVKPDTKTENNAELSEKEKLKQEIGDLLD